MLLSSELRIIADHETHRNDQPALTCVETFDYLGFTCLIGRDHETRDWPMFRDGQIVGYARSKDEGCATLRELCETVAAHTRATTADMAADAAEFRAELAERTGPEWSCTPENPCDGECVEHLSLTTAIHLDGETSFRTHSTTAERDEYLRYNPSAWVVVEHAEPVCPTCLCPIGQRIYDPVTGVCLDCQGRAAAERVQDHPAPATPPRPVDELRTELDQITDIISEAKRRGEDWSHLREQRAVIIAELDAAHKAKDAELRARILEIITPTSPRCSSCGDPSDGTCPACWESGEQIISSAAGCPGLLADAAVLGIVLGTSSEGLCQEPPYALLADPVEDDRDRTSRDNLDAEHAADETHLERVLTSDPCADVRRELEQAQTELECLSQVAQDEAGCGDVRKALCKLRDQRDEAQRELERARTALSDLLDLIDLATIGEHVSFHRSENGQVARARAALKE